MLVPQMSKAGSCPTKSTEDWIKWFEDKAKMMARNGETFEKEVIDYSKDCGPTWNLKGLSQCSERLVVAAKARAKREEARRSGDNSSMGWEMSDKDYARQIPDGMDELPDELKDGLPKNYREIAKQKGWKVFKYRSRTVPNPPSSSFARVLIVAEDQVEGGKKVDKYIQFTISDDPNNPDKPERLIDYLAVEHNKDNPDKNAQIHFAQFWRDADGTNAKNKIDRHMGFDNCYSCHPNGVRELSPEPGSYSKEDAETYAYLKKKMGGYGKVEFNGALTPEAYGAPMGKEQGCTKCHNNYEGTHLQSRGALNYRTSQAHIAHKMNADLSMPVTSLTPEKELQKTIDQIPYLLTPDELKKFQSGIRGIGQEQKNEWAIDELKKLGKIDEAKHKQLKFVLNGHPNYPNCLGEPDCYIGIKKTYQKMQREMRNNTQYASNNVEWFIEKCSPEYLIPNSNAAVEDGSRSNGGIINTFLNFIGLGDDSGSGSQQ